jgi:hypothetical protein
VLVTNKSHFKGTSLLLLIEYSLADIVGGNGEDLGSWGREAGGAFRVQRLHCSDDIQRFS